MAWLRLIVALAAIAADGHELGLHGSFATMDAGPDAAVLHALPTLWLRSSWILGILACAGLILVWRVAPISVAPAKLHVGRLGGPGHRGHRIVDEGSGLEYNGTSLNGLFAQRRNLLRPRVQRYARRADRPPRR